MPAGDAAATGGHRFGNRQTKPLGMTKRQEQARTIQAFSDLVMAQALKRFALPTGTVLKTSTLDSH